MAKRLHGTKCWTSWTASSAIACREMPRAQLKLGVVLFVCAPVKGTQGSSMSVASSGFGINIQCVLAQQLRVPTFVGGVCSLMPKAVPRTMLYAQSQHWPTALLRLLLLDASGVCMDGAVMVTKAIACNSAIAAHSRMSFWHSGLLILRKAPLLFRSYSCCL